MILVTGGTGFLGSYIVRMLVRDGKEVRVLCRETSDRSLLKEVEANVDWAVGNILDVPSLEDAMEGVDVVIHAAAVVSFHPSETDILYKINIEGTANVVNTALYAGVDRMIYVSSSAALGRSSDGKQIDESVRWEDNEHVSRYGRSKHLAEREVWRAMAEGMDVQIINPTLIVGGGFWDSGTPRLFQRVDHGLKFYTPGVNGYVDVRDVSAIVLQLLNDGPLNEQFLISAENLAHKDFFIDMANVMQRKPPAVMAGKFLSAIVWRMETLRCKLFGGNPLITKEVATMANNKYFYDSTKVQEQLNFKFRPISETIADTVAVYLKTADQGYGVLGIE